MAKPLTLPSIHFCSWAAILVETPVSTQAEHHLIHTCVSQYAEMWQTAKADWTVLYCTVLYCTVLYCTVLYWQTVLQESLTHHHEDMLLPACTRVVGTSPCMSHLLEVGVCMCHPAGSWGSARGQLCYQFLSEVPA